MRLAVMSSYKHYAVESETSSALYTLFIGS
jgi:hypothetical protein